MEEMVEGAECPLQWWKIQEGHGLVGPNIALLARHCFSVPGSSGMLERAFRYTRRAQDDVAWKILEEDYSKFLMGL